MHARVVRFTDVDGGRIADVVKRIEADGAPPPELPASSMQMLHDADQGTAVALVFFESAEDMRKGAEYLDGLDSSETPGSRASVDLCEVLLELQA